MRQFSIRTLMAVIVVSAVGLAALRNANELWAEVMLVAAFFAVGVAVLGAVTLRGREQVWWLGSALFSGVYLVFTLVPFLAPQIGMTHVLEHLRSAMFKSTTPSLSVADVESALREEQKLKASLAHLRRTVRNFNSDPAVLEMANALNNVQGKLSANKNAAPQFEHFHSVGHSLFALLAGLIGGAVAAWFYERREQAEAAAG